LFAFACSTGDKSGESLNQEYESDYKLLQESIGLLKKANGISNELSSLTDPEQINVKEAEMISLMKKGINTGKSVSNDFLGIINPNMVEYFKNNFLEGHELLIKGMRNSYQVQGIEEQQLGIEMINSYFKWAQNQNTKYKII
jgi:hypothetical protein